MNRYLTLFIISLFFIQCKGQKKNDDIIIIAQPIMEKDATNSIKILFKNLSRQDSIFIGKVDNIELNSSPAISQTEINGTKYLEYYTYLVPTKTGEFKLPIIKAQYGNEMITAKPSTIEVVDKIPKMTKEDVILKLTSNKNKYKLNDTINFSLYEYSRFYDNSKRTLKRDSIISMPKLKEEKGGINIQFESDLYKISGIENLENYTEDNFDVIDFDWDPFRKSSIMAELDGKTYIKTLLLSVTMIANKKGAYIIGPSQFIYIKYNSMSDYLDSFAKNDDGTSYEIGNKGKVLIETEKLKLEVK